MSVLGISGEPAASNSNTNIHELAKGIDAFYDSMLYEGMPWSEAFSIEQQRQAAHDQLTRDTLGRALEGFQRPGRIR